MTEKLCSENIICDLNSQTKDVMLLILFFLQKVGDKNAESFPISFKLFIICRCLYCD